MKLKTKVAGFECQRRGFSLLPGTGAGSDSRKEWSVTLGGCAATVVGTMPNMPGIRDRIQPAEIFMDAAGLEIKPNSYSQCLKTSPKVSLHHDHEPIFAIQKRKRQCEVKWPRKKNLIRLPWSITK